MADETQAEGSAGPAPGSAIPAAPSPEQTAGIQPAASPIHSRAEAFLRELAASPEQPAGAEDAGEESQDGLKPLLQEEPAQPESVDHATYTEARARAIESQRHLAELRAEFDRTRGGNAALQEQIRAAQVDLEEHRAAIRVIQDHPDIYEQVQNLARGGSAAQAGDPASQKVLAYLQRIEYREAQRERTTPCVSASRGC